MCVHSVGRSASCSAAPPPAPARFPAPPSFPSPRRYSEECGSVPAGVDWPGKEEGAGKRRARRGRYWLAEEGVGWGEVTLSGAVTSERGASGSVRGLVGCGDAMSKAHPPELKKCVWDRGSGSGPGPGPGRREGGGKGEHSRRARRDPPVSRRAPRAPRCHGGGEGRRRGEVVGCFSISFPSGADQPPPSRCRFMDKKLSCECRPPGAAPGPEFSLPRVSAPGRGVKGLRGRGGAPSPPPVSVPSFLDPLLPLCTAVCSGGDTLAAWASAPARRGAGPE